MLIDPTELPALVAGEAGTDAQPVKSAAVPQQNELLADVVLAVTKPFRFALVPAIPVAAVVCTVGAIGEVVNVLISPYE